MCCFFVELVMNSFSCLIMYIMNVHNISFDEEILLTFVEYDNNSIGNVQTTCEGGEL